MRLTEQDYQEIELKMVAEILSDHKAKDWHGVGQAEAPISKREVCSFCATPYPCRWVKYAEEKEKHWNKHRVALPVRQPLKVTAERVDEDA